MISRFCRLHQSIGKTLFSQPCLTQIPREGVFVRYETIFCKYRQTLPQSRFPQLNFTHRFAEVKTPTHKIPKSRSPPKKNGKSTQVVEPVKLTLDEELAKLNYFQRYKKLFKEYWYVLLPVHTGLSIFWLGSCYLAARSGIKIDVVGIMEWLHFPDIVIKPLRSPHVGYWAVALALYKIIAPLRYVATVTICVPAIKYFVRRGAIKPVPSRESIRKMVAKRMGRRRKEK